MQWNVICLSLFVGGGYLLIAQLAKEHPTKKLGFLYWIVALIVHKNELNIIVSPVLRNLSQYGGFFCYMGNGIKRCRSPPSENLFFITQFKFSEVYYGRQGNQARIQQDRGWE